MKRVAAFLQLVLVAPAALIGLALLCAGFVVCLACNEVWDLIEELAE